MAHVTQVGPETAEFVPPKLVDRNGRMVYEHIFGDSMRKEYCLCLHCGHLKLDEKSESCAIAADFLQLCKRSNNAFMMTRCTHWVECNGKKEQEP